MASNAKKKTTMAKLDRERRVRMRRHAKQLKKDARKFALEHPELAVEDPDAVADGDEFADGDELVGAEDSPDSDLAEADSQPAQPLADAVDQPG
jgi:hypothetical protein